MDQFGGMPFMVTLTLIALLVAYLSLFPAFACWLASRWKTAQGCAFYLLWFPACWLFSEWLRAQLLTGFPWLMAGYSQIDSPLVGFAPLMGVYGLTWLTLLIAGAAVLIIRRQSPWWLPTGALMACVVAGQLLQPITWTESQPPIKVALVQGNVPLTLKWIPENRVSILTRYRQLSENLDAEVIVWPESAMPLFEIEAVDFLYQYDQQLKSQNQTLITGIIALDTDTHRYYNALLAIGGSEQSNYQYGHPNRYYKRHLLPIGEFVPFEELLRPLAPIFNIPQSSFSRGDAHQGALDVNQHTWVAAICYEILFGEELRDIMTPRDDAIITVSNDTWFGRSIGPDQHLEIARMRAVEFNRPVVRGTNTGLTAMIDASGAITAQLPVDEEGVLTANINPATGTTPYQRWGLLPVALLCCAGLMSFLLSLRAKKRYAVEKTSSI
jgi:apolipoprotein N-acyltransferase